MPVSTSSSPQKKMAAGYAEGFGKGKDAGFDWSLGDMAIRGIDREPARLLEELASKIAERVRTLRNRPSGLSGRRSS